MIFHMNRPQADGSRQMPNTYLLHKLTTNELILRLVKR